MAVLKFTEPSIDKADLTDWTILVQRNTEQFGGFITLGLTNMDNTLESEIVSGSRLEVNRSLFWVQSNETITGNPSTGNNGINYIYAIPASAANDPPLRFSYDATAPAWNAEKGGWYKPDTQSRAVATFVFDGNRYSLKIILDSFNAMNNPTIRIPEWQKGYLKLNMSYMNNSVKPTILAGSVIEVDGKLFEITANTVINDNTGINSFNVRYLFANLSGESLVFNVSVGKPDWVSEKNGWYFSPYNTARCIAKFYSNGTDYFHGKTIIDSFNAFSVVRNDIYPTSGIGNSLNIQNELGNIWSSTPGMYYYEIRGGSSGTKTSNNSGGINQGIQRSGWFVWYGSNIEYGIGQNGGNAENNSSAAGGGGMSFVGPIIAHGGAPEKNDKIVGCNAGGIYGGQNANGAPPSGNTDGYVRLWRAW